MKVYSWMYFDVVEFVDGNDCGIVMACWWSSIYFNVLYSCLAWFSKKAKITKESEKWKCLLYSDSATQSSRHIFKRIHFLLCIFEKKIRRWWWRRGIQNEEKMDQLIIESIVSATMVKPVNWTIYYIHVSWVAVLTASSFSNERGWSTMGVLIYVHN